MSFFFNQNATSIALKKTISRLKPEKTIIFFKGHGHDFGRK